MTNSSDLDKKILNAQKSGSMSTRNLADDLGVDKARIYRRCRWLEKSGLLKSSIEQGNIMLLYCIDCGKVVTREDYEDCKNEDHDLRSFYIKIRIWSLNSFS